MTTSKVVVKSQWLYGFDAADANAVYVAACSHIALGPNPLKTRRHGDRFPPVTAILASF